MNRRNWLQLARKLVDQFDMDYTLQSLQAAIGRQALGFFGEGVLPTSMYPNPFPITMSGASLGGSVGTGYAYDPNGQITEITPTTMTSQDFTITTADPTHPRWDLLVITYVMTGQTPIPKPSDPISTVDLNLVDDFALAVRPGTPSATPAYPAKQTNDIILAGLQVPANATLGTSVFVDLSIRDQAIPFVSTIPIFISETPTGTVDGANTIFNLSHDPITSSSLMLYQDGLLLLPGQYSLAGTQITFATAPPAGSDLDAWYIENSPISSNPFSGVSNDLGTGDGATTTFSLPGTPASKASVQVYVDGLRIDPTEWSLVIGSPDSQVIFNTAPAVGQDLSAYYLVNTANVGSGISGIQSVSNVGVGAGQVSKGISGTTLQLRNIKAGPNVTVTENATDITISASGGGGGGSGQYVPQGDDTHPITIDPAVGIVPTSDMLSTWYVQGQTGNGRQPIAAVPQIEPGVATGARLALTIVDAADYITLANDPANGVSINGVWPDIGATILGSRIELEYGGGTWWEVSRR